MKRRQRIEAAIVSCIIASTFAFLVYQLRFNREFLYDQARALYEERQYNQALNRYMKFLRRYPKGKYVRDARQTLFCDLLPAMGQPIDRKYIALAFEALEDEDANIREKAELAILHAGLEKIRQNDEAAYTRLEQARNRQAWKRLRREGGITMLDGSQVRLKELAKEIAYETNMSLVIDPEAKGATGLAIADTPLTGLTVITSDLTFEDILDLATCAISHPPQVDIRWHVVGKTIFIADEICIQRMMQRDARDFTLDVAVIEVSKEASRRLELLAEDQETNRMGCSQFDGRKVFDLTRDSKSPEGVRVLSSVRFPEVMSVGQDGEAIEFSNCQPSAGKLLGPADNVRGIASANARILDGVKVNMRIVPAVAYRWQYVIKGVLDCAYPVASDAADGRGVYQYVHFKIAVWLKDNEPSVICDEGIMNGQCRLIVVANARENGELLSPPWMSAEGEVFYCRAELSELKEETEALGKKINALLGRVERGKAKSEAGAGNQKSPQEPHRQMLADPEVISPISGGDILVQ